MTPQSTSKAQSIVDDVSLRRALWISVLVLASYYFTSEIGFEFSLQPGSVSTLWMPNSILLVGLLLTEKRWWWIVILASFPAHLASELQSGVPMGMVLSWFASNSIQALIGAFGITMFCRNGPKFENLKGLMVFLFFGAFLPPFLSSFLDSALVKLNGWGHSEYWDLWRIRFLSNVIATLTLVPFVLVWVRGGLSAIKRAPMRRIVEAGLLTLGLIAVGLVIFTTKQSDVERTPSLLFWPLPFLLWATVRFGLRGISSSLLVVMFLAIIGATKGAGPFVWGTAPNNALSIQWFLILVSIPMMVLAVVVEERRRAVAVARENEERLTLALNSAQMETWEWKIADDRLLWTDPTKQDFGFAREDDDIGFDSFLSLVHPDDRPSVESAIKRAVEGDEAYEVEFRVVLGATTRWYLSKGKVFYGNTGKAERMLGLAIDITARKHTETELADTNGRNRAILRALPDMMFLQNRKGDYLDFYVRDSDRLLVPPDAFLGKNAREVLPKDLADRVLNVLANLDGSDQPQVLEYSLHLGGEDRFFEARLVAAEGDQALSIVRDVTAARHGVEALRQSEERLLESTLQIRSLAARLIAAQESERRRVSVLLHDDFSQNVAALGLAISRLKRKPPASNEQLVAELDKLGSQTKELTTQIRRLSHQLNPDVLEHLGLVAALESHLSEFGISEKIATGLTADVRSDPLPLDVSLCFYRVALEALRNVSKHSGAEHVNIALREDDGFLMMQIADSGRGFDVERAKRGSGLGLASSEERIRLLQGSLEIRSDSRTGTTLMARVPLSK